MNERLRGVLTAVWLTAALAGSAVASQPSRDPDLTRVLEQIRAGDPETALATLDPLLRRWSRSGGPELATAYLYQGIAHTMLNAEPTARGAFREAARLDPTLTLAASDWPPRVLRLWNEVRAAAAAAAPPAPRPTPAATPAPALVVSRPKPAIAAPTPASLPLRADDADLKALLSRIETTMQQGDPSVLDAAYDRQAMIATAMAGLPGPPALTARFQASAPAWNGGVRDVAEGIRTLGSSFRFLRTRLGAQGRLEAVFRLRQPAGGANYFFYALGRDASGPRVVDILALNFGLWESETARQRWTWLIDNSRTGAPDPDAELNRHEAEVARVKQLQLAGQNAEALAALGRLPASLQARRDVLLWRAVLAQTVDPAALLELVRTFEQRFPGDPALRLLAIDAHAARGEYDLALASVARLDETVGGDAHLDAVAAGLLLSKGDLKAAHERATKAATTEPTLPTPWFALLGVALAERNHAEVAWALTVLETRFQQSIGDLAALPQFAEFVRSPEYTKWAQARGRPLPPPPPAASGPVRVGGAIQEPRKLVDALPLYPEIAKSARVQGIVILECTISPQGDVAEVAVLRGNPLLDQAAIDAVKQWRYAPTLLNGVPVAVIMTVTVNFRLDGDGAAGSQAPAAGLGTLVLYWPPQVWGKGARVTVGCDDGHVADLGQKRRIEVSAAPGPHKLLFEDRWRTVVVTAGGRHFIRGSAGGFPPHGQLKETAASEAEAEMREKEIEDNEADKTYAATCGQGEALKADKGKPLK